MVDFNLNEDDSLLEEDEKEQTVNNHLILKEGFEESVRIKLGVKSNELGDEVINTRFVSELAETQIIKRVPRYNEITDLSELLFLESAVISYMCYLLAPSMKRRVNLEVTALDVKWKKDKVDWDKLALDFLAEVDAALAQITSVEVDENSVEPALAGLIIPDNTRIV